MNRLIQTKILNPIAEYIVRGQTIPGTVISIGAQKGQIAIGMVGKSPEKGKSDKQVKRKKVGSVLK